MEKQKKKGIAFDERLKNWPIRVKLLFSHGIIIITTFILIFSLLISLKYTESRLQKLHEGPTKNIQYSAQLYYPQIDMQRAFLRCIIDGMTGRISDSNISQLENTIESNVTLMTEAYNMLEESLITEKDRATLEKINEHIQNEAAPCREKTLEYIKNGQYEEASAYVSDTYKPIVDNIKLEIKNLEISIETVAEKFSKTAEIVSTVMLIVGAIFLVIITSIAIWISTKVTRMITEPVKKVMEAAEKMSVGELSAVDIVDYESEDELGELSSAMRVTMTTLSDYVKEISELLVSMAKGDLTEDFNQITDFLGEFESIKTSFVTILSAFNSTLSKIQDVSLQVDTGSDELAQTAVDLANGTSEQASASEELTATVNTVTEMAQASAKEAEDAYHRALESVDTAENESKKMQELQEEMNKIQEISAEIETIIKTIEEIASQTSLLALNASIEAARAGDAGRGFAVVADQIGKLAQDSSAAVVSTKQLIEKTVEEIEKGNKITEDTAVAFSNTIAHLNEFATVAKSLNENAGTQAKALDEIEAGVEQITQVTQQNAASAQESTAISEELAARATELNNLVDRFILHKEA